MLAVDECDRLGHEGMELIRYAAAQKENKTTVILVGYKLDRLFAANPALDSRIPHRVPFRPSAGEDAITALRSYHPAFARATEAQLMRVTRFSDGRFRLFAQVLKGFLDRTGGEPSARLTDGLLTTIFTMSGRVHRA